MSLTTFNYLLSITKNKINNNSKKLGLISVVLSVLLIIGWISSKTEHYNIRSAEEFQRSLAYQKPNTSDEQTTADEWQFIGDPKERSQIYSAYFDSRLEIVEGAKKLPFQMPYGSVRIIAILPLHTSKMHVHCNFRYTNWETENEMLVDSMRADAMPENRNLEFSVFAIVCPLTTHVRAKMVNLPDAVGINIDNVESMRNRTTFVRIKYPRNVLLQEAEKKIAVCVPPAHKNYSNALRIVEQLEIYRRLGVAKFYFYNSSITSNVEKVFNYYKEVGVASIIPWNIRSFRFNEGLRNRGILASRNDCVYRATFIDGFKYIIGPDFDEIIIPFKQPTFTEFLDVNDQFSTVPKNTANDFLYTQVQITRQQYIFPAHARSKYIVKGQSVIEIGNHFIWQSLKGKREFVVPAEDGLLFHYRDDCVPEMPCLKSPKVKDDRARVFDPFIWQSVDFVCAKIFADGKCPK